MGIIGSGTLLFHGVYVMLSDVIIFYCYSMCHQSVSEPFGKCLRVSVVHECKSSLAAIARIKSYLIAYVYRHTWI